MAGCFRTTPQGALMNDAALRLAEAFLNIHFRHYQLRQMMMPDALGRGRMIRQEWPMAHSVEGIEELIPEECLERRSYEYATLPDSRQCLGDTVIIQEEALAKKEAEEDREGLVLWTDSSRKQDEWVGCAVVWKEEWWQKRRVHHGQQKEAFDAEMDAVAEAVKIAENICRKQAVTAAMVFTDSQTSLTRIQLDQPGPEQVLALQTMWCETDILKRAIPVEYWWVPAHKRITGNDQVDQRATKVAYKHWGSYTDMQNPVQNYDYDSFAHSSRQLMETKWEDSTKEIDKTGVKSKHSYQHDLVKKGGNSVVMMAQQLIVARFYQLKSGYGLMAQYLRQIGKRRNMKCWWCAHEYQTRDHLCKWSKRWKQGTEEALNRRARGWRWVLACWKSV